MDPAIHKFIVEANRAVSLFGAALRELAKATAPSPDRAEALERIRRYDDSQQVSAAANSPPR